MKSIIIYFSLTGNTEKIAGSIWKGIKNTTGHCDLVKIKDANPKRLYEYDLIGLGSMVFGTEPLNVTNFIKYMRYLGGKHIFIFSTHGASPLYFFPSIHPKLIAKGLTVIGMRDWYGDANLYHCPKPYLTDGHPDEIDLKEAEEFGREMVENSQKIAAGETQLIPPAPPKAPNTGASDPDSFPHHMPGMGFHKEKCIYPECRLCMENCPMHGIDLSVDPPIVADPCMACELCVKICPTGAVEADEFLGYSPPGTAMGSAIRRFFMPFLEQEEAEGRFRRKVKLEDIGWDTPLSKRIGAPRPHWIIGKGWTI